MFALEEQIFSPIEADFSKLTARDQITLNDWLRERSLFLDNEDDIADILADVVRLTITPFLDVLPVEERSHLTVPLYAAVPDLGIFIQTILCNYLNPDNATIGIFKTVNEALRQNLFKASGVSQTSAKKPYVYPTDAKLPPDVLVETYLKDTPLRDLFHVPVPFAIPHEQRFSGHWIVAPPGRGKTTLLQAMVRDDIDSDAAIIIIDSKGDVDSLIEPFLTMKSIADRLIIIDPDPQRPIAINPLDIPKTQVNKAVELLEYLFASLLEFKLTPTQSLLFRNVIRFLVTQYKTPTLDLFREFLSDGWDEAAKLPHAKYRSLIGRLDPHLRDFFYKDFGNENYSARRREVLQRLQLLLDNDAMRAMLSSVVTRFTFDEALDAGKIIIINNSKDKLTEEGAEFFGRFFIAQLLATAQRRSSRPRHQKRPVFCYIDECQNVIKRDEKISTILDECRSQRIGLVLAHQRTEQIESDNVLSALQNCAIRFANSDAEARKLSASLRASEEFLKSLDQGQFAAYIRDFNRSAIAIDVTKPEFPLSDQLTVDEQQELRARMTETYGYVPGEKLKEHRAQDSENKKTETPDHHETPPDRPPSSPRDRGKRPKGW